MTLIAKLAEMKAKLVDVQATLLTVRTDKETTENNLNGLMTQEMNLMNEITEIEGLIESMQAIILRDFAIQEIMIK